MNGQWLVVSKRLTKKIWPWRGKSYKSLLYPLSFFCVSNSWSFRTLLRFVTGRTRQSTGRTFCMNTEPRSGPPAWSYHFSPFAKKKTNWEWNETNSRLKPKSWLELLVRLMVSSGNREGQGRYWKWGQGYHAQMAAECGCLVKSRELFSLPQCRKKN